MTVNLELDPQVLAAATQIAESSGRSVGAVVSELARKGLAEEEPTSGEAPRVVRIEERNGFPVAVIEPTPPPIDPEVVRRELEEND